MKNKFIKIIISLLFFLQLNYGFDTLQVKEVGPGVLYLKLSDTLKPLSIDVLKIDLKNSNNYIDVFVPYDTLGVGGLTASQMSKYISKNGKNVIAGINADFFGGEPMQAQNSTISNSELIKGANLSRSLLLIDEFKNPRIDKFVFYGELKTEDKSFIIDGFNEIKQSSEIILINNKSKNFSDVFHPYKYNIKLNSNFEINKEISFELKTEIEKCGFYILSKNPLIELLDENYGNFKLSFKGIDKKIFAMVGGLPRLYKNSKLIHDFFGVENLRSEKFIDKNPRTAAGYNAAKDTLTLVAVDGRQPNHSMGMNLYELSNLMKMLGCTDAINLDGGGSTSMVIRDSVVNKPSDFIGERVLYSMLMVLSKNNSETKMKVTPKFKEIMQNHTIDFDVHILDDWEYETKFDSSKVKYSINGLEASINKQFEFYPRTSGIAEIIWYYKDFSDTTNVFVIPGE